jgi:hypothetical protein
MTLLPLPMALLRKARVVLQQISPATAAVPPER